MKKILIGIIGVVVLLVIVGLAVLFFSLNTIVQKGVETGGSKVMKVDVKLGAADISPFSGAGALKKFVVSNPPNFKSPSAFQFDEVKVSIKIPSVWSDTVVVDEVNIQGAQITLEGTLTENNLSDILNNVKGQPGASPNAKAEARKGESAPAAGSKSSKKIMIKDFVLAGAKLNLSVTLPSIGNKSLTLPVPDLHLQNIGTGGDGVTVEEMIEKVLTPLLENATKAAADELAKSTLGNLKLDKKDLGNAAKKGLSDLLNSK